VRDKYTFLVVEINLVDEVQVEWSNVRVAFRGSEFQEMMWLPYSRRIDQVVSELLIDKHAPSTRITRLSKPTFFPMSFELRSTVIRHI
jgi:hypothetical protein